MNLEGKDIGYIISSASNSELITYLYSRGYELLEMKDYYQGEFRDSILAWTINKNQETKRESLDIIRHFDHNCVIFKEIGKTEAKKIFRNGSERPLRVIMYNTDPKNHSFICEGVSFSFVEKSIYKFPKNRDEFKNGMIVECYSNSGWIKKTILNAELEYNNIYRLLSKYNKVRITV